MKGYKVPEHMVDGIKNRIALFPKDFKYAWGMDEVVEDIETLPLEELDDNWHTGTPTEEGDYLVKLDVEHHVYPYYVLKWANGWYSHYDMAYPACPKHSVIKWQKIEETD